MEWEDERVLHFQLMLFTCKISLPDHFNENYISYSDKI